MVESSTPAAAVRSRLALVGAVLAVVCPPVGFLISLVAIRRINRDHLRGRGPAIFGVVCGAVFTMPFLLFAWLAIKLDVFGGNAAQDEAQSLVARVQHAGGKALCDNGDGGHGIDNRQPWYQIYLKIADRPSMTDEIKADAAQAGYPLAVDTERVAALKNAPESLNQFNPKADYFVGQKKGNHLQVTIDRDAAVPLYCGVEGYGDRKKTGADDAIVTIHLQLPDR